MAVWLTPKARAAARTPARDGLTAIMAGAAFCLGAAVVLKLRLEPWSAKLIT